MVFISPGDIIQCLIIWDFLEKLSEAFCLGSACFPNVNTYTPLGGIEHVLLSKISQKGLSYILGFFNCAWAYSVISKECATDGYGFGHVLGHNFGTWHNVDEYGSTEAHVSYAHGLSMGEDQSIVDTTPSWPFGNLAITTQSTTIATLK